MKVFLGSLAALLLATTLLASPAEARCWWNGYARVCNGWHGGPYWRSHYGYGYPHSYYRGYYGYAPYSYGGYPYAYGYGYPYGYRRAYYRYGGYAPYYRYYRRPYYRYAY